MKNPEDIIKWCETILKLKPNVEDGNILRSIIELCTTYRIEGRKGITRQEAIKVLEMVEAHGLADEAKQMAISDMRKMSYITDRPCAVCKFNEDGNGRKKWTCVFEGDGKETDNDKEGSER